MIRIFLIDPTAKNGETRKNGQSGFNVLTKENGMTV